MRSAEARYAAETGAAVPAADRPLASPARPSLRPTSAPMRRALALLSVISALAAVAACQQPAPGSGPRVGAGVQVAPPLGDGDAYEQALTTPLAKSAPAEGPGLQNVFCLSERIWTGSEPHGEAALRHLAALGIRTVVSVDGKVPDHALAASLGLRYVHVPIKYSGISRTEMLRLAKTFRELPSPFYVHCFHGKHRGPTGAAVGRLVLDGAGRDAAIAEMRQWCGTSGKYPGLYKAIAHGTVPTADETAALAWDFPAAHALGGLREAMIVAPRAFDNLEALATRDFATDPEHPDIDAQNEAAKLHEALAQAAGLPECADRPDDFRAWLDQTVTAAGALREALGSAAGAADADARARARGLVQSIDGLCTACHRAHRNR